MDWALGAESSYAGQSAMADFGSDFGAGFKDAVNEGSIPFALYIDGEQVIIATNIPVFSATNDLPSIEGVTDSGIVEYLNAATQQHLTLNIGSDPETEGTFD